MSSKEPRTLNIFIFLLHINITKKKNKKRIEEKKRIKKE
jgi:hypothetical protein